MKVSFSELAWQQYLAWQFESKAITRKINELIKDIGRHGLAGGRGKPEALKGCKEWSRRIDQKHRLVYILDAEGNLLILSCEGHYED